jgi:anti-sigma factor RsiW
MDHVIERYLAGQLSDAEADAFERNLEENPEVARDVERVARMKTGFEVLARRGELAPLLKQRQARTHRKAWATAAAAALFALGYLAMRNSPLPAQPTLLASSLASLSRHTEAPVPLRASISLARARGMGADVVLESPGTTPGAADLEIATGAVPGAHFSAELLAARAGGGTLGSATGLAANADGVVHLFLSLQPLPAGVYLLRLTPAGAGAPLEYSVAIRAAADSAR